MFFTIFLLFLSQAIVKYRYFFIIYLIFIMPVLEVYTVVQS